MTLSAKPLEGEVPSAKCPLNNSFVSLATTSSKVGSVDSEHPTLVFQAKADEVLANQPGQKLNIFCTFVFFFEVYCCLKGFVSLKMTL